MRPIPFDNSYQTLADSLFHRQQAEPVSAPQALLINTGLAEALKRAEAYHAAGADALLVHSKLSTAEEIESFAKEWGGRKHNAAKA